MDNSTPQAQLAEKLKAANYVMVTVGRDPSVDQLSALIGLTLMLNKAGKHAAAVFSGQTPSTIEFLKPEDTIEKTTDSLRDFIIALDKSKADKLRYKVENDVVRIFITPYKTSITADDLEFSQGDFNVDVVIALGVTKQEDLDEAIISNGRILHDATVATINLSAEGDLGSIHWQDPRASSLSEMMTELARLMGSDLIDSQIATALLTGIVAETDRFSNDKTSAAVMSASATLMAAGANQQLVASQLAQSGPLPSESVDLPEWHDESSNADSEEAEPEISDGSIEINHHEEHSDEEDDSQHWSEPTDQPADDQSTDVELPEVSAESDSSDQPNDEATEVPELPEPAIVLPSPEAVADDSESVESLQLHDNLSGGSKLITEPPTLGGELTANSHVEALEPSGDPLSAVASGEQDALLTRPPMTIEATTEPSQPNQLITGLTPPPPAWIPPQDNPLDLPIEETDAPQTLTDLEEAVHTDEPATLDNARDEVSKALNGESNQPLEPVQALNAQPMMDSLNSESPAMAFDPTAFGITGEPGAAIPGSPAPLADPPQVIDPNAAPPVPPPIPFNFGAPPPPPAA